MIFTLYFADPTNGVRFVTQQLFILPSLINSLSSGAEDNDTEDINEDYDKGYSELNNEIDGQVSTNQQ